MDTYYERRLCPKCNYAVINDSHKREFHEIEIEEAITDLERNDLRKRARLPHEEHISRECNRCKFVWAEKPLTQEER